jgi:hypothetical protein
MDAVRSGEATADFDEDLSAFAEPDNVGIRKDNVKKRK